MNKIKKLAVTLLVLFMLVPTFAFAQEVEETPELKAKIQNIVNTMPEDDAIEAIENLFGENDRPHFATRSAKNFVIYKMKKDDYSMAEKGFTEDSNIVVQNGEVKLTLYTTPVYYLGYQADVTGVTIIGDKGVLYKAKEFGSRKTVVRRKNTDRMVPTRFEITIPKTEIIPSGVPGYPNCLNVKFNTNLADDFRWGIGDKFPEKMKNPIARVLFN